MTRECLEPFHLTQLELFDSCSVAVPPSINGIKSSLFPSVEMFVMGNSAENANLNQSSLGLSND